MKLRFILAQSNPGAVGFSLQLADARMSYLATKKLSYAIYFVIRFVLDSLPVFHDTLLYRGMYLSMSFEA